MERLPWWAQPVAIGCGVLGLYLVVGATLAAHAGVAHAPFISWDGLWYARIAQHGYAPGYAPDQGGQGPAAFFPLFPGSVAFLHGLLPTVPLQTVGLGLNLVAVVVALSVVDRCVRDWPAWQRAGLCLLLLTLPGAFVYAAFYSEALFLLGAALAVYGLRQPHRLGVACTGAAIAGADRPTGVFVVLAVVAVVVVREHDRPRRCAGLAALAGSGLAAVLAVDWALAGSPFAFLGTEHAWARFTLGQGGPGNALRTYVGAVFVNPHPAQPAMWGALVVPLVAGLAVVAWRWDRVLATAALGAVLLPLYVEELPSIPRLLLGLLPAYIGALAVLRSRRPTWVIVGAVITGGLALNLLFLHRFLTGQFAG
ncbi:MAG TPA: hypothetical protein VI316_00380 [Candidatus Dormibacteraeota bacterium]